MYYNWLIKDKSKEKEQLLLKHINICVERYTHIRKIDILCPHSLPVSESMNVTELNHKCIHVLTNVHSILP